MKRDGDSQDRRKPLTDAGTAAERAAVYALEDQVGFLLRCAHQRATEIFNDVMGRFGVTPTQFAALAKLDDLGSVSQNQLGRLTAHGPGDHLGRGRPPDRRAATCGSRPTSRTRGSSC